MNVLMAMKQAQMRGMMPQQGVPPVPAAPGGPAVPGSAVAQQGQPNMMDPHIQAILRLMGGKR